MADTQASSGTSTSAQNNSNGASKPSLDKPKRTRKTVGLPSVTALASMHQVNYTAYVAKEPMSWDSIENHQIFSLTPDGGSLYIKTSRSKAVCLKTRKSLAIGYGQGFAVDLITTPVDNKAMF
ncbi:hypothetical protein [Calothrix sp. 336/3]|uniref:hypothetical protein n=1 Tax=Calothrix sp. 336/3 TaxID=1337936 RepID=UPI0004E2E3B1|nr:hypothetical protein [Calothrix sp. 336/3]AKG24951.1 hypothetical protein IJ00_26800 [Calothrix sp. 336/3]